MFRFENPLDPSKDGQNPLIDGIRYNIRNSEMIKEQVYNQLKNITIEYEMSATDILDTVLQYLGYSADELIIADEHELLDYININFC